MLSALPKGWRGRLRKFVANNAIAFSGTLMAERVGFEPTDLLRGLLISSQARSAKLRHLSAAELV